METVTKKFTLKNVVVHFVNVLEPAPVMGSDTKTEYSCRVVLPSGHPQAEEFIEAVAKLEETLPQKPSPDKELLKSYADDSTKVDFERFPEYKNGIYFKCKTQYKPQLLNSQKQPANDYEQEQWMWNGAVVHISLTLFTWSNKFGNSVGANLRNLMLTGKGNKVESGSAADDFAEIESAPLPGEKFTENEKKLGLDKAQTILEQIRSRTQQ